MNKYLQDFLGDITWVFREADELEVIGERSFNCSKEFEETFPSLTKLLNKARITKILYRNQYYELFGWTNLDFQSFGWLCLEPKKEEDIIKQLHPDHIILLKSFGGITERWNEPEDTWLVNLNNALTYEDAQNGTKGYEELFNEICADEGIEIKLNTDDFISFAFEANGNVTMYHKQSGEVLMLAHDHNFDFITPFETYPEYTLHKFNNCRTFSDWIEKIAVQMLNHIHN